MELIKELKDALQLIEKKLGENKELTDEELQTLFLKSLIEEETGNGASTRK